MGAVFQQYVIYFSSLMVVVLRTTRLKTLGVLFSCLSQEILKIYFIIFLKQGLTLSLRLKFSGSILAYCNLCLSVQAILLSQTPK